MAIRLRSLNDSDFRDIRTEVRTAPGKDAYNTMDDSLDSRNLFGDSNIGRNVVKDYKRDNKRAYITLREPTLNYVLSGSGKLLAKMLGIREKTMESIMNFSMVWSLDEEEFVRASDLKVGDNFICGARYLEKLIEEFDLEEETLMEFEKLLHDSKVFTDKYSYKDIGTIKKSTTELQNAILLAGDYYLTIDNPATLSYVFKKGKDIHDIEHFFLYTVFDRHESRLSYLLNLDDKEPLWGMLNYKIVVLPPGLRPKQDGRIDRLTKAYTKIIHLNQKLSLASGTVSPSEYINQYRDLDNAVCSLQHSKKNVYDKTKGATTILEKIKGKKGQIRQNNLGKRIDYSGRAAVIVNPYLSIEKIKIPKSMAVKIFKFHLLPYLNGKKLYSTSAQDIEYLVDLLYKKRILQEVPVVLGRQPTLHKQSLQGFYAELTDAEAIEVPALVCPGFNMDFDGDTGHTEPPLSKEAIKEVADILLTSQNIFLEKSGKCTIVPRQDMLYGLYFCTRSHYEISTPVAKFDNYSSVYEGVCEHAVKVWETVLVSGTPMIAGYAAVRYCFPKPDKVEIKEITSKTIGYYTEYLLDNHNLRSFVASTDKLVTLGFKTARLYTKSVSLLKEQTAIPEYDNALDNFHKEIEECQYYYNIGLEDTATYNLEYGKCIDKLKNATEKHINTKLGEDSGYRIMSDSGARGNKDNLNQMFSFKGRIAASSTETINVLLENSYASGLSPMEGFIASYGGRKGLIDKSLKTADTGYFSRKLWHTTQGWVITNEDCGTKEGITIRKIDLAQFFPSEDERIEVMKYFIEGRYEAGSNMFIDKKKAELLVKERDSVTIRSPIKCANPCCQKCYGISPGSHKDVAIGTAVGIIAAQSIGEPSTQLTMKQFQKGGVAGKNDITSSFDRLDDYVNIRDIKDKQKKGKVTSYEPVAWATGKTKVIVKGNKKLVQIEGLPEIISVPNAAVISPFVEKGHGLYAGNNHGDYYLREIEEILGEDAAKIYLVMQMFNLYKSECTICPKHFEVLAAAMTHYMVLHTDRKDLKVGQFCDRRTFLAGDISRTVYRETLLGIGTIPQVSLNAMATIQMEYQGAGLARSSLLGLTDNLDDPIQRMVFGLKPKLGTHYGYQYKSERRLD